MQPGDVGLRRLPDLHEGSGQRIRPGPARLVFTDGQGVTLNSSVNMVVVIITILSETLCSGVRASLPILRKQKLTECSEPASERHTAHTEAGVGTRSISYREWC